MKNKKKIILFILLPAALIGALAFAYIRYDSSRPTNTPDAGESVNLDPPREEDKQAAADNKERILEREKLLEKQAQAPAGSKRSVKPLVTYINQTAATIDVAGVVSDVFEDGGECTTTFTKASVVITRKVAGVKEGKSVYCPTASVPIGEFTSKGEWSVSIKYDSLSATGMSDPRKFEVK